MVLAGITSVGEFHYLHHDTGGVRYREPDTMGRALGRGGRRRRAAADPARHVLPPRRVRERSPRARSADSATARPPPGLSERRRSNRSPGPAVRIGAAIHSVRAVDPASLEVVAAWADERGAPLHAHVSEQPAEDRDVPRGPRSDPHGAAGPVGRTRGAVHRGPRHAPHRRRHRRPRPQSRLGVLLPDDDRDLADGIGPTRQLRAAGARLTSAATRMLRSICSRRPVAWSCTSGCTRARGATTRLSTCSGRPPPTATPASAGRRSGACP